MTQQLYSGSATRTPSLPYSTPRVTYSRVQALCQQTPSLDGEAFTTLLTPFSGTKLDTESVARWTKPTRLLHNKYVKYQIQDLRYRNLAE